MTVVPRIAGGSIPIDFIGMKLSIKTPFNDNPSMLFEAIKNVQEIELFDVTNLTDNDLSSIAHSYPKLQSLQLSNCGALYSYKGIETILQKCTFLCELSLLKCSHLSNMQCRCLFATLSHDSLKFVEISGNRFITSETRFLLSSNSRCKFDFDGCPKFVRTAISDLMASCDRVLQGIGALPEV